MTEFESKYKVYESFKFELNNMKKQEKRNYKGKEREIHGSDLTEGDLGICNVLQKLKRQERMYITKMSQSIIITYRNCDDSDEYHEELACILGVTFEKQQRKYIYPNRFRYKTLRRAEGKGFAKILN